LKVNCSTKGLYHESIKCQNRRIFSFLISHGVDVNECNDDNETPLIFAAKMNDLISARDLLDNGADPSITDPQEFSLSIYRQLFLYQ